jgi:hypothetical protein
MKGCLSGNLRSNRIILKLFLKIRLDCEGMPVWKPTLRWENNIKIVLKN